PEMRYTQSQTPVSTLNLATSERRKDAQSGNWIEHTEWHNVVVFGKTAENCSNFLKKGREIFVEGRLQTRKWQDKEGKDRWTTEIVASNVQFLGGKGEGGGQGGNWSGGDSGDSGGMDPLSSLPSADSLSGGGGEVSFDDDDIPF
ncbi:MAG: single-stranded DNA-binding protein, partial [Bdellovibrionales bacterium]|nr:single-stranded DNA-binding protein [Bdellovibrionales bacterium]